MKIVIIVHSNFGVGHFNRAKNLADALADYNVTIAYSGVVTNKKFWKGYKAIEFSEPDYWINLEAATTYLRNGKNSTDKLSTITNNLFQILSNVRPCIVIYEFLPFFKHRFIKEFISVCTFAKQKYGAYIISSVRDIIDHKLYPPKPFIESFLKALKLLDHVILHGEEHYNEDLNHLLKQQKVLYE